MKENLRKLERRKLMKIKNSKMETMLEGLKKILPHRDKVGYIAARNARILKDNLTEYFEFKNDLIEKFGKVDLDKDGKELQTVTLKCSDDSFKDFLEELKPYGDIEHEVSLVKMKYNEAIGILSGEEILENDWMFED